MDQYHEGETGSVFDGAVDQVTFGWTPETCRAVGEAVRFSLQMSREFGEGLDTGPQAVLAQAIADLDYRCALAASRDRHPASTTR